MNQSAAIKATVAQTPKTGFAIGNGTSRESFDLERLRGHGVTVGCNWLIFDWPPDYIVSLDVGMSNTIRGLVEQTPDKIWKWLHRYYPDHDKTRTWLACDGQPVKPCVEINQGWNNNSGVMAAAYLAEILNVETCYLIGIDFFLPTPGRENDLYGRSTRQSPGLVAVWNNLVANNPQTRFVRVGPIADFDRNFYEQKLVGFELMESFEGMPI